MELCEVLKGSAAESFVMFVKFDLENINKQFFDIGFRLWEARYLEYYKELGYESIEELSEKEFDFKRSSTYNFIKVFTTFAFYDRCYHNRIDERFKDYSYSQLVELAKIESLPFLHLHDWFPPSAPVREFSAYIRYYKDTTLDRLKFAEWREHVFLPRLASRSSVQFALSEVQTSGQPEVENTVPEVQTSGQVEEQKPVSEVQTSGHAEKVDVLSVLEKLIRITLDTFEHSIHHKASNGLFLKVVPSAFAEDFKYILEKNGYTLAKTDAPKR